MDKYVTYSNQNLKEQKLLGLGGVEAVRKPVFDIAVSAQKATEYTKVAQNELVLQLYQLGFFNPEARFPALLALDAMDFEGKEELAQKITQQGTLQQELAKWQGLALNLAQKFDPQMAEGLAQSILPGQAPAPQGAAAAELPQGDARQEAAHVKNARERAQEAAQPE